MTINRLTAKAFAVLALISAPALTGVQKAHASPAAPEETNPERRRALRIELRQLENRLRVELQIYRNASGEARQASAARIARLRAEIVHVRSLLGIRSVGQGSGAPRASGSNRSSKGDDPGKGGSDDDDDDDDPPPTGGDNPDGKPGGGDKPNRGDRGGKGGDNPDGDHDDRGGDNPDGTHDENRGRSGSARH